MRQSITLQTNDPDVTGGDILGRINFAASNESSGSESQWIGASIYAQASGEFTPTVNPTNLVFATSDNNGTIPRLIVSNAGNIFPNAHLSQNLGSATNSFLSFYTATGVISERVKIANVATPPAYALDVSGTGYFSNAVITSGSLIFASGNVAPVGVMQWDNGEGTASLGLKGGNVNLEIGQEQLSLCYNGTGAPITKGKVVYIIGAQGQRPSITLASNSTEVTSSKTLGVVAEDIANGAEGFVATYGIVRNLDTSAFLAGSGLWLGTSGNMTMVRPVQPAHGVHIGYAMHINASSGRIFVRVQNGFEIEELHNVLINSGTLASGDVLAYNSSNGLWENTQRVAASGSGLTTNYVTKAISSQNIANSQIFDNGTNVGIGTTSPGAKFNVVGDILSGGSSAGFRTLDRSNASAEWALYSNSGFFHLYSPNNYNCAYWNPAGTFYTRGHLIFSGENSGGGSSATPANTRLSFTTADGSYLAARIIGRTYANNLAYGDLIFLANPSISSFSPSREDLIIRGDTGNIGIGTTSPGARLQVDAGTNTTKGLIVKAAASQTATLTEWQNSAGTILSSVNNVGIASFAAFASGLFNCDVEVSGHLQARTKSFVVDHPTQPGAKLHYGSLESPYHGIRLTGSGVAVSGYCTVNLPDYIGAFVHPQDINIQLTPINHFNAICVHSVDTPHNNFVVSCNSYEHSAFYWDFTAVRKDVDRIQVENYDGHIL